jgi:hypothetical protein
MINIGRKYTKPALFLSVIMFALAAQALLPALAGHSSASSLSNTLVRFDSMTQSTFTSGTVCAAASAALAGTEASVKVTFPTGYTVSTTAADWAVSTATTSGWPSGATAWPGIAAPTGTGDFVISGQSVTFQSTDISDTTEHCFNWTNNTTALETASSPANDLTGSVTTQAAGATTIDSGNYATATVSSDQVSVSATVNPTFSMALANTTDALGVISPGAVKSSTTPATMTVSTNAKNGWSAWGSSANAGLKSTTINYTIASNCSSNAGTNSTLSAGTEGYNLGLTKTDGGAGTITIATPFVGGVAGKGGGLCTNSQILATSNGSANNAVLTLKNNAAISGSTPAANDYADTETFVAGGLF